MFCIVSFIVLSILGIFSASNRQLAREALDCVLRRVTLRPCNTGFDEKMKAKLLGVVITRSEGAAMFLNRYFEALAWVFFVVLLASSVWSVRGVYEFYTTGSCNGLNSSAFCVFDPTGANNEVSTAAGCQVKPASETDLTLSGVDYSIFPEMNSSSGETIVMIGCYHCDYTREVYPIIRSLAEQYRAKFYFLNYPVKEQDDSFTRLSYSVFKLAPDKFWQFNDLMFTGDKSNLDDPAYIDKLLSQVGLNPTEVRGYMSDPLVESAVQAQLQEAKKTGFYGTPTVFINGKAYVGPKPYRVYAIALKGLLYWLI
jgi:thiol-disulfide isomerase/thioredoxin